MQVSTQNKQNTSLRPLPHLVQVMDSNLSARSIPDWFCGFWRQTFYILDCGRIKCLQVWFLLSYDVPSWEMRVAIILGCIVCKVSLLKIEHLWACVCLCVCHSIMLSRTAHMSISPLPSLPKLSHYQAPAMKSNARTVLTKLKGVMKHDGCAWIAQPSNHDRIQIRDD